MDEKGQIAFYRPLNSTHYKVHITIPFDWTDKAAANSYFTPQTSKAKEICSIEDMIGKWVVVFRGTNYPDLNFELTERILSGTNIEPVC